MLDKLQGIKTAVEKIEAVGDETGYAIEDTAEDVTNEVEDAADDNQKF